MSGLPSFYDAWRTASEDPVHMKAYAAKCEDCECGIRENEYCYELFGSVYCENCMELNYRADSSEDEICSECGEEIPFDTPCYYINGNWFCENCMDFYKVLA